MFYALQIDSNGIGIGAHAYGEEPNSLASGEIACTADQAQNPGLWQLSNGILVDYTPPPPSLAQQVALLLAGTLTLTSTSTPALNGAYALDAATQDHIQAEMLCATVTGRFADGTTELVWLDAAGTSHTFPSVAEFQTFALAVAAFVAACYKVLNGTSTTLPSNSVTIA